MCMFSFLYSAFLSSHSIAAGTRGRIQLGPLSQIIRSLSCHTDPALSSSIHSGQKQLSHIYGQKQGQRWRYCDITATLHSCTLCKAAVELVASKLVLEGLHLCDKSLFYFSIPICFVDILGFSIIHKFP